MNKIQYTFIPSFQSPVPNPQSLTSTSDSEIKSDCYMPLINIFITYIIWRFKKSQHSLIDSNAKNSLNFQISITIYIIIWLIIVLFMAKNGGSYLGDITNHNSKFAWRFNQYLSMFGLPIYLLIMLQMVCSISAAITAYQGKLYRYPLTIRFFR